MKNIIYFLFMITVIALSACRSNSFEPVTSVTITDHYVQVWAVNPSLANSSEYEISIQHALAGPEGAFYIVAWEDTDGDGLPDHEIARSGLMTADSKGQWSSFVFRTASKALFVGNAWSEPKPTIYYEMNRTLNRNDGLGSVVYFSREIDGIPTGKASPRYTNIKFIAR
jgi:hypothetical protein